MQTYVSSSIHHICKKPFFKTNVYAQLFSDATGLNFAQSLCLFPHIELKKLADLNSHCWQGSTNKHSERRTNYVLTHNLYNRGMLVELVQFTNLQHS